MGCLCSSPKVDKPIFRIDNGLAEPMNESFLVERKVQPDNYTFYEDTTDI